MKATIKVVMPVIVFFGLAASSLAGYVDGFGVAYTMKKNQHGVVLKSKKATLYLGKSMRCILTAVWQRDLELGERWCIG